MCPWFAPVKQALRSLSRELEEQSPDYQVKCTLDKVDYNQYVHIGVIVGLQLNIVLVLFLRSLRQNLFGFKPRKLPSQITCHLRVADISHDRTQMDSRVGLSAVLIRTNSTTYILQSDDGCMCGSVHTSVLRCSTLQSGDGCQVCPSGSLLPASIMYSPQGGKLFKTELKSFRYLSHCNSCLTVLTS